MNSLLKIFILAFCIFATATTNVHGQNSEIILLSNSIDNALAEDFVDFLKKKGIKIIQVDATSFNRYENNQFIVILGGPDALEDVGSIVRQHITIQEQEYLRISGNKKMVIVKYPTQTVFVIAGSDRNRTREAQNENRENLYDLINESESFILKPPSSLPGGSKIIYSGEYIGSLSYWGYTKSGGYTTVKLQGSHQNQAGYGGAGNASFQTNLAYPYIYVTFKDSELPVKFKLDKLEYEIIYYNNTQIIVKS
jgi:hypothetical protein